MESFYAKLNEIIDTIENLQLLDLKYPAATLYQLEEFINIPEYYDKDIFVSLNDCINLNEIFEEKTAKVIKFPTEKNT